LKYQLHIIETLGESTESEIDFFLEPRKIVSLCWLTHRLLDLCLASVDCTIGSVDAYVFS
jgi:hypothetical protein